MRARIKPARRARDTPIMSVKLKRFHSSPFGPHHSPPSLNTPSTSIASARIFFRAAARDFRGVIRLDRCSYPPKFLDDGELAFIHALDSVTLCLLPQPNIAYQPRNSIGFEGSSMVRTPHRPIHRYMALDTAGSECSGTDTGRNARFMARVSNGDTIPGCHPGNGAEIQFGIGGGVRTGCVHQN